jgi:hypothetical protein
LQIADTMKKIHLLNYLFLLLLIVNSQFSNATIYTVNNVADNGAPGTLRTAINNANGSGGLDTIRFNFSVGVPPFTISLTSSLPDITDMVLIDGYSQTGTSYASGTTPATLAIVIAGNSFDAFRLSDVTNCTIRGIVFNKCNSGVAIVGGGSNNNQVCGNYFGISYDGTSWVFATHSCSNGVALVGGTNNIIGGYTDKERNIITGNTFGILVGGQGTGNVIVGNFVGVDAVCSANAGLYNATGILMSGSTSPLLIGGTLPGSRNIISGNYNAGVFLNTSDYVTIQGNYIGTDYTGLAARPNAISNLNGSIQIGAGSHNKIGGITPAARNVIS